MGKEKIRENKLMNMTQLFGRHLYKLSNVLHQLSLNVINETRLIV